MKISKKFIYCLVCPVEEKVRYVGKTKNLKQRLSGHIHSPTPSLKSWIVKLKGENMVPKIILVESVDWRKAGKREIYWINYYESVSGCLLNVRHKKTA